MYDLSSGRFSIVWTTYLARCLICEKTGAINALCPVLKIETHLRQKIHKEKVLTAADISCPAHAAWACEFKDPRQDFQKKNESMSEWIHELMNESPYIPLWGKLSTLLWLKLPIKVF